MRIVRILTLVVFALGTLATFQAAAKPEDSKKTGKNCAFCHEKGNPKGPLTDAGKYYKEKKTLEGYKEPAKKS